MTVPDPIKRESRKAPRSELGRLAILIVCVLALGGALGALLVPVTAPTSIVGKDSKLSAPVLDEKVLDSISVNIDVTTTSVAPLTTAASGTVTENSCTPGGTLLSGTGIASIDGQPLIALATSQPFWRDLSVGESGSDVTGIQLALQNLGYKVPATGTFNRATLQAVVQLAKKLGDTAASSWTTFPMSQFVWTPASSVVTLTCGLQVGATVAPGGTVATLPPAIASAQLQTIPSAAVPGDRVVELGSLTLPVSASGQITGNENLTKLSQSDAYRTYLAGQSASQGSSGSNNGSNVQGGDSGLPATYQLASALSVTAVSPAALYDQSGEQACVQSGGAAIPVTVVGSELGESYVTLPAGKSIRRVSLDVTGGTPCR